MWNKITFLIGQEYDKNKRPLTNIDSRRLFAYNLVSVAFGGYTARFGHGGWTNLQGELIQEGSLEIMTLQEHLDDVMVDRVAREIAEVFDQEAVGVMIEGVEVRYVTIPRKEGT